MASPPGAPACCPGAEHGCGLRSTTEGRSGCPWAARRTACLQVASPAKTIPRAINGSSSSGCSGTR
eukprot:701943-Lingulodinium_polyedra.AAC.1